MLWVGVHRQTAFVVHRPSTVNIIFSKTSGSNLVCRVRRQEIVNFMTPPSLCISLKIFFSTLEHSSDRLIKSLVMMTKEGSTKIVHNMIPGAGILVLRRNHISHIVKMHYFFEKLLLYSEAHIRQT